MQHVSIQPEMSPIQWPINWLIPQLKAWSDSLKTSQLWEWDQAQLLEIEHHNSQWATIRHIIRRILKCRKHHLNHWLLLKLILLNILLSCHLLTHISWILRIRLQIDPNPLNRSVMVVFLRIINKVSHFKYSVSDCLFYRESCSIETSTSEGIQLMV